MRVLTRSNTHHNNNTPRIVDPVRYKTVMCVNWAKSGTCPYDFKCQFAHGAKELRERKDKAARKGHKEKAKDDTPVCSPCSSRATSPAPSPATSPISWRREDTTAGNKPTVTKPKVRFATTPPRSPAPSAQRPPRVRTTGSPPALLSTTPGHCLPPGLGHTPSKKPTELPAFFGSGAIDASLGAALEPSTEESKMASTRVVQSAVAAPIDLAGQGGAAGRFAAAPASYSHMTFVPAGVRALWPEESGDAEPCSPLACNSTTGKVELKVPWLKRRVSSASNLVRRAVSFVLDEQRSFSKRASFSRPETPARSPGEKSLSSRSWSKLRRPRPAAVASSA